AGERGKATGHDVFQSSRDGLAATMPAGTNHEKWIHPIVAVSIRQPPAPCGVPEAVVHALFSSDVELAVLHASDERAPFAVGVAHGRLIGPLGVTNLHTTLNATELDAVLVGAAEAGLTPLPHDFRYRHSALSNFVIVPAMSSKDSSGLIATLRIASAAAL